MFNNRIHINTHKRKYLPPLIDIILEDIDNILVGASAKIPGANEDPDSQYSKQVFDSGWGDIDDFDNSDDSDDPFNF